MLEIAAATRTKSLRAFPNLSLITSDYRSARSAPDLVAANKESFLLSALPATQTPASVEEPVTVGLCTVGCVMQPSDEIDRLAPEPAVLTRRPGVF
jgi:hypothetical protein